MKVCIALPAYTGTVHIGTQRSLVHDMTQLMKRGDRVWLHDEVGNGLIADARALIVAQFLASDADHLVFVDWDVIWEAGALVRLVDYPVDFVAGIYPKRQDPISFAVSWDTSKEQLITDENGLLEVKGVPAGFMRCSREMLQEMSDHYSDLAFYCDRAPNETAIGLFSDYWLDNPDGPRLKLGEDYAFCRRWTDMGGKIFIDPLIDMGHVGNKTFEGNLGNWLRCRS